MVLSFILVQNRQGKTRLAKWYAPYTDEEKVKLKGEVTTSIILCLSVPWTPSHRLPGPPPHRPARPKVPVQLRRVPFGTQLLDLDLPLPAPSSPEPVLYKDCVPPLRRALLLCLRRRQRQRARLPRSHPLLR